VLVGGGAAPVGGAVKGFRDLAAPPARESSYLEYECGYRIESDDGVLVANTLPSAPLVEKGSTGRLDAMSGELPDAREVSMFPPATDVSPSGRTNTGGETFVQRRTKPTLYVYLTGHAKRLGYPVAIPELLQVGGKPATPCNRSGHGEGFGQTIVGGDAFG